MKVESKIINSIKNQFRKIYFLNKPKKRLSKLFSLNNLPYNVRKFGFSIEIITAIKVVKEQKKLLSQELRDYPNIKSVYVLTNCEHDFLIECLFKNLEELKYFYEKLNRFKSLDIKNYFIMDDLKKDKIFRDIANARILKKVFRKK